MRVPTGYVGVKLTHPAVRTSRKGSFSSWKDRIFDFLVFDLKEEAVILVYPVFIRAS